MGMFDDIGLEGLNPIGVLKYCVDIVMLIDSTASMASVIDKVKEHAVAFYTKLYDTMDANGKDIEEFRVKVISFRDYAFDGIQAMEDSGFFSLPDQNAEFRNFVNSITAKGGGGGPESALEAMALAMQSDWTTNGDKRRHIIIVFTDASAVPLKESSRTVSPYYPSDMPSDLAQLGDMWGGCAQQLVGMPDERFARLILFTPNIQPWCDMQVWNNVWPSFSKPGRGLDEIDIDLVIQPYGY